MHLKVWELKKETRYLFILMLDFTGVWKMRKLQRHCVMDF